MITNADTKNLIAKFKTIFTTKKELQLLSDNIIELINVVNSSLLKELKSIRYEIKSLRDDNNTILSNHELRLDRLEDKVYS